MNVRGADVAAVTALALVLALALAAPILRAPSERVFGLETVGREHDPFTAMAQFGRPLTFGVYTQPLTDVAGALLARVSGPVAAYNWLIILSFPLSAAAAYLLARHLRLSHAGAALAALAFAFSPFHLAHAAYHPHIAQTQWIPLYLFALWRSLDDAKPAALGLLAVSAAGVALSNFYGGLIAAVTTPAAIAMYWCFKTRGEPRSSRHLAITVASLAVLSAGGAAYAWNTAHPVLANHTPFAYPREDLFRYSAKWWSYLVPPVAGPMGGPRVERAWSAAGVREGLLEQQVSLGWGVVALGLVAILMWTLRDRRAKAPAVVPVLAGVALFALVCSLSPERSIGAFTVTRPSALLYTFVPMFRSYARFGVVVQLMAVLLAAAGAERLWRAGTHRARTTCAALVVLSVIEYSVWPPAMWRDVLPTSAHRWVAARPDHSRALDCAMLTPRSESVEWLTAGRISLRTAAFDDCTQPRISDKLRASGYTHLLVREHTPEGQWFASRDTPPGLTPAARFHDAQVFAVAPGAPAVYSAGMTGFFPREHDETWSWRWMGLTATWTVVNTTDRLMTARLAVEMTAFRGARDLRLLLDGRPVQTLTVEEPRRDYWLGPLTLAPGEHELVFQPAAPPHIADDLIGNGDRRPLSFGVGTWRWQVEGVPE